MDEVTNYPDTPDAPGLKLGMTLPILILGTVGNSLALCVLFRCAFKGKTFAIFLRALAVADLIIIWIDPLTLNVFNPDFPYTTPEIGCRVYSWVFAVISSVSSWTLVLVTLERVVIVYKPHMAHLLVTEWRAVGAVMALWFTFGTLGTFSFALKHKWENMCTLSQTLTMVELATFMCLYSMIPAIVICTCNIIIITIIHKANKLQRSLSEKRGHTSTTQRDRITRMLVINSLAFVVLTLPEILVYAIELLREERTSDVLVWIANFMRRLNHAGNFFLYCIGGALFRRELVLMVHDVVAKLPGGCGIRSTVDQVVTSSSAESGQKHGEYSRVSVGRDALDGPTNETGSTICSTGL